MRSGPEWRASLAIRERDRRPDRRPRAVDGEIVCSVDLQARSEQVARATWEYDLRMVRHRRDEPRDSGLGVARAVARDARGDPEDFFRLAAVPTDEDRDQRAYGQR